MSFSNLIIENRNDMRLPIVDIESSNFKFLYDEKYINETYETHDGSIISRSLDITCIGKNMLIFLGIKEIMLHYLTGKKVVEDIIIVKSKRDEKGYLWKAKLKTTSKVNELIYINSGGGKTKICFNFCPCCNEFTHYSERYPLYLCGKCIDTYKPRDINGNELDIQLNEFGSVGVFCDNKLTNLKTCYINGIECNFTEYRFGGFLVFTPL